MEVNGTNLTYIFLCTFFSKFLMSSLSSFSSALRFFSIVGRGTFMNLTRWSLVHLDTRHVLRLVTHIFPTPLYRFTSPCSDVISSIVNCKILRSRSLAAICCLETFSARWDWTAVCCIWTKIYSTRLQ